MILNRPTSRKHERAGAPIYFGGPVMGEVLVALFRAERAPEAAAFRVLKDVYLSMHRETSSGCSRSARAVPAVRRVFRLGAGTVTKRDAARRLVRPAGGSELLFRKDTKGMWDEMVRKARARVAMR